MASEVEPDDAENRYACRVIRTEATCQFER